uniref:Uncharacterized protein n=1 Tax=Rhizophora mucronata TaxID=61149 RepID=A0A2P2QSI3_RHIMU
MYTLSHHSYAFRHFSSLLSIHIVWPRSPK